MTGPTATRRSGTTVPTATPLAPLRTFLVISGLLMVLSGALILIWPDKSAVVLTWIIAGYTLVIGIVYAAIGLTTKLSIWSRIGHILLGILFVVAAIIAFMNPAVSTISLAIIVTVFIGVSWIFDGIVSLTTISMARSKGWTVLFALLSLAAGIILLISPLIGGLTLWLFFGASLLALGLIQTIRAFTIAK